MRHKALPSREYLHATFEDVGDTIAWKVKKSNNIRIGQKVVKKINGYYAVKIDRSYYSVHRILFKMRTGLEPQVIDHIDGNRTNNLSTNLRGCSMSQNTMNSKISVKNTTGVKNVRRCSKTGKFLVTIICQKKKFYGGRHDHLEEAATAASELRKKLHGEFARDA